MRYAVLLLLWSLGSATAEPAFTSLLGWGGGDPAKVVPAAAAVGFTDIAVWNKDSAYLQALVAEGQRCHVGVYACVWLGDLADWRRRYPDAPPPTQVMTTAEEAAALRLAAEVKAGGTHYQYGGEPAGEATEVSLDELLCFHNPRVIEFFRAQIRDLLAIPGLTGIAFDYFGYRNYRGCHCPRSAALLAAYRQAHPDLSDTVAADQFARDTLVAACNELADEARRVRPGVRTTGHVYPVFLPEILYGNRLHWDTCGQSAAWFFEPFWALDKIRRYSRVIAGEAQRYWPAAAGAGLIGIYNQPGKYSVKGVERVAQELQAMRDGGLRHVQVCSLGDVLKDPATCDLFRRLQGR